MKHPDPVLPVLPVWQQRDATATKIVVALGGRALLRQGDPSGAVHDPATVARAADALAAVAVAHQLFVTHSGCPNDGVLVLQAGPVLGTAAVPFDGCQDKLDTGLGHLEQELVDRRVSMLWSRGPVTAAVPDARLGEPGVDEDLAVATHAFALGADALVLATDVPAVVVDRGTLRSRDVRQASPEHLRALPSEDHSIGAKVESACRFVEGGGRWAAIGALEDLEAIVTGDAGTRVVAGPGPIIYRTRQRVLGSLS